MKISSSAVGMTKTTWDAAHSGSQRSQCKTKQNLLGRSCPETIIFFAAGFRLKCEITMWTRHPKVKVTQRFFCISYCDAYRQELDLVKVGRYML